MAVDVSNLVNLLATQPGQNMANLGNALLTAQESVREREQQQFKNAIDKRKMELDEALANKKMTLDDLEIAGRRGELIAQTAQGIMSATDPLIRQQILTNAAPTLLQSGVTPEQIRAGYENLNNSTFWNSVQAMGVGANEYWKEKSKATSPLKAPTTRNIREGNYIVNQEWHPEMGERGDWIEVGRGPVGKGFSPTINLGRETEIWGKVFDRYESSVKDIVDKQSLVSDIQISANTPGGASAKALQASIAELFGGDIRAVAELEKWGNFGNLPDRVINSASQFFSGEYSERAKGDVLRLLRAYQVYGLNPKLDKINERFTKVAEQSNVPVEFFMREIPQIRNLDFANMSLEDIANIDETTLELDERQALEDRLSELGY